MKLGEKIRYLRLMEGTLRGLGREMSQPEVVRAMQKELKKSISQAYLSQIESGARPHLTNTTRLLLARFFKVHPGYLVDDPEGFSTELASELIAEQDAKLDLWLVSGAERFRQDPELSRALITIARYYDSKKALQLVAEILETPELIDRLWDVLNPGPRSEGNKATANRRA